MISLRAALAFAFLNVLREIPPCIEAAEVHEMVYTILIVSDYLWSSSHVDVRLLVKEHSPIRVDVDSYS